METSEWLAIPSSRKYLPLILVVSADQERRQVLAKQASIIYDTPIVSQANNPLNGYSLWRRYFYSDRQQSVDLIISDETFGDDKRIRGEMLARMIRRCGCLIPFILLHDDSDISVSRANSFISADVELKKAI